MAVLVILGLIAALVGAYYATRGSRWDGGGVRSTSTSQRAVGDAQPVHGAPDHRDAPVAPEPRTIPSWLRELDLQVPMFTGAIGIVELFAGTGDGGKYTVDCVDLSCSCPDFTKVRSSLPPRDIRRVCKHLAEALEQTGALEQVSDQIRAVISPRTTLGSRRFSFQGVKGDRYFQLGEGLDAVVLSVSRGREWVDVFARRGESRAAKHYRCYGFSVRERRWSYQTQPAGHEELEKAADEVFAIAA